MDLMGWIGRFHPVLVHMPIGILVAGLLMQWFVNRNPAWGGHRLLSPLYLLAFVFSSFAALAGWWLASEGGYDISTLFWHRWLGVAVVLASFTLWRRSRTTSHHAIGDLASAGVLALVILTGHLGGKLTHGPHHLVEHAPNWVKALAGYDEIDGHPTFGEPDSVHVYTHLIRPVLEKKCWSCHSDALVKGGLNMEHEDLLLKGGRNGKVIEATASSSELFKRVILDPESRKFMPPKGVSLSYNEIKMLEWWIDQGGSVEATLTDIEVTPLIQEILMSRHQIDTRPKSFIEKVSIEPVDPKIIQELIDAGFMTRPIAMTNNFLDVKWKGPDSLDLQQAIYLLEKVPQHIAWLDLSKSKLQDQAMASIGKLENLVRLRVENNPITDDGVKHLENLKRLESLNLYGTKISDISIQSLSRIHSLRKLYVWQTDFSEEGTDKLRSQLPNLDVVGGYAFSTTNN